MINLNVYLVTSVKQAIDKISPITRSDHNCKAACNSNRETIHIWTKVSPYPDKTALISTGSN